MILIVYLEATTSLHSMVASSRPTRINERRITEDRMPPFHSIIVKRNNTKGKVTYMQQKYYEILVKLAEIAEEYGSNTYSITYSAFGAIPFKNGENKAEEVGTSFLEISRWLLDEAENTFSNQ